MSKIKVIATSDNNSFSLLPWLRLNQGNVRTSGGPGKVRDERGDDKEDEEKQLSDSRRHANAPSRLVSYRLIIASLTGYIPTRLSDGRLSLLNVSHESIFSLLAGQRLPLSSSLLSPRHRLRPDSPAECAVLSEPQPLQDLINWANTGRWRRVE
eukprot:757371-Hanusia_phi.AAC.5